MNKAYLFAIRLIHLQKDLFLYKRLFKWHTNIFQFMDKSYPFFKKEVCFFQIFLLVNEQGLITFQHFKTMNMAFSFAQRLFHMNE